MSPSLFIKATLLSLLSSAVAQSSASSASVPDNLPQNPLVSSVEGYTIPGLQALTSGQPEATNTVPLDTTYPAGSTPTIAAAPSLPTLPAPANYPALDVIPPLNSTEVQGWLAQIDFSKVPTYNVTTGDCATSPSAITDGRCWWTCGGCTRETDITECPDKLTWGLSYDDGPSPYTPILLDYLNEVNVTTTFFVVGSRVISRPEMLQSEYMAGHQISVHTWSHPYLTSLTNEEIVAELGWTQKVIRDTLGVTPNTFRPPYGDIDDRVRAIAAQMGMTPIIWTSYTANGTTSNFDTTDWNIPGGKATGASSLAKFEEILSLAQDLDTGFIVLAHDLYQVTVDLAVGYVLPMALQTFKLQSIVDCLGLPASEAYIETSSNTTQTVITSAASTFFQASLGTATGAAVTPTSASGADNAAVSGSSSGSGSASAASGASSSGAAGKKADVGVSILPALVALMAVAMGVMVVA